MAKGSEAINDFPGTSPLPEKRVRVDLEVIKGGLTEGKIIEEVKEEKIGKVSPKVERKIVRKVSACIAAGIVTGTGGFIALGETGNLPGEIQEWYGNTSESIRSIFGIEIVEDYVSQNPEAAFDGLLIEGLEHVFQNGRWEYIDSDGLRVGFWNDTEGRYEHTASVLRGEWKGLFVNKSLEETRSLLVEDGDWSAGNWDEGKIKVPVLFNITNGGTIEEIKALGNFIRGSKTGKVLGIRDLPDGAVIYSPLPPEENALFFAWTGDGASFDIGKGSIFLNFNFRNTTQCLIPDNPYSDSPYNGPEYVGKGSSIFLGYPILEAGNNDILSKVTTALINPFLSKDYQVLIISNKEGEGPINFSFENLLRDEKGRFIFINPNSKEVEVMGETIEKETKNAVLETEKKVLEEKLEESSIIDQEKTAPNINGLIFDEKSGFYLAGKDNGYGLTVEEKAGFFKDGFLSLKPAVIKALQAETKKYSFPIPLNPAEGKIRIAEVVDKMSGGSTVIVINLSEEMTVYSPREGTFSQRWGRKLVDVEGNKWESYESLDFELPNKMGGIRELDIKSEKFEYIINEGNVNIGTPLAKTDHDITFEIHFEGSSANMADFILKIGNIPVFIMPNE